MRPAPPQGLPHPGSEMTERLERRRLLLLCWRVVGRRKGLMLSIVTAAVGLGVAATLLSVPLYSATVRLQIDRQAVKVIDAGATAPLESVDADFMRTQIELLLSRAMAERVVAALRLADDPGLFAARQPSVWRAALDLLALNRASPPPDASHRARHAVAIVMQGRVVRPLPGSRLVEITCSDPVPARAQKIAAAYGEAFMAANVDKRIQANSYAKAFLTDQVKQLKHQLETSERALLSFAEREQIVAAGEGASDAESTLSAAHAQLSALIAERIRSEQAWNQVSQAKATAIDLPQLLSNAAVEGLRARRKLLETEYREKLETFKPSYPAMVQIRNKMHEIDRQLAAEVETLKASFRAAYENAMAQQAEVTKRIGSLKSEVLDLHRRSIQYNLLKRDVDSNRQLYEGVLQRLKEVDLASGLGTNNVYIIDRPELPEAPSSPSLPRALLISLLIGVALACASAYGLERLDDTLHDAGDVERLTGLPALGIIPRVGGSQGMEAPLTDARSPLSEAYGALCATLQFLGTRGMPGSIFVTSAGASEGKSCTSFAIARHFALHGKKVLLIDADLRKPSLHVKLGCSNDIGLTDYLAGTRTAPQVFQATDVPMLVFMAAGLPARDAADLMGGTRLAALLAAGRDVFDLIVVDGPPVLALADALVLGHAVEATVLVVAAGDTRSGALLSAVRRLAHIGVNVLGTLVTKADTKGASSGYDAGYDYAPQADVQHRRLAALRD